MSESHSPELSHRNHPSEANPGESFTEPWVGQNPTIAQRRDYLVKYFLWAHKPGNAQELLGSVFKASLKRAAKGFFESGREKVPKAHFWHAVDKAVWYGFFGYCARDKPRPKWPWRKPIQEDSATFSTTYDMWFKALKTAKKPRETSAIAPQEASAVTPQSSLKRPLESIEDRPVKRIVLRRSSSKVEQKDQSTEPP